MRSCWNCSSWPRISHCLIRISFLAGELVVKVHEVWNVVVDKIGLHRSEILRNLYGIALYKGCPVDHGVVRAVLAARAVVDALFFFNHSIRLGANRDFE